MPVQRVSEASDSRLGDYRNLPDATLRASSGKFVAESEVVVRKLLASPLRTLSILVTEPRLDAIGATVPPGVPVYVAAQAVIDGVAGFHVHRGCLAIGERPAAARVPDDARTLVVAEDLVDVDNLGALVRNAAAFGADAIVLSPRCADPFYRKAIRVSAGSVFHLPVVRVARWPEDLMDLRARFGMSLVGAVLDAGATPLPRFDRPPRVALLCGSEGPGLSAVAKAACDALVTVPMAPGADSLNVATAAAVVLYHLTRRAESGPPRL